MKTGYRNISTCTYFEPKTFIDVVKIDVVERSKTCLLNRKLVFLMQGNFSVEYTHSVLCL